LTVDLRQPGDADLLVPASKGSSSTAVLQVTSPLQEVVISRVSFQPGAGERLVACFGCMYYRALRPEEVMDLRQSNLASLPEHGWGELI
jgi:hypothetical protein